MQYAVLIYAEPDAHQAQGEEAFQSMFQEYVALTQDPRCLANGQLQPIEAATTVHVHDGRTMTTDGPFAETKEVLGGYYIIDVGNLDEAIEFASRVPAARIPGGSIEVRPLVER
ncbi:MAG TPA: YciI family protein [Solirubrobacteraceae bacterium]|nr:YciI family protein [Solirubrobacteraceae bacterium]